MTKYITIHSFRGGTGKTTTSANVAAILARVGLTVGVIDTDIYSPGLHALFGMTEEDMPSTLNDYIWGKKPITDAVYDMTDKVDGAEGKLFVIPASIKTSEISRLLRDKYDPAILETAFKEISDGFKLDALVIDTHPGLSYEVVLCIALCQTLGLILRPDQQDFQGTHITMELAKSMEVEDVTLIVNKAPPLFNPNVVEERVTQVYGSEVAAVVPHSDEILTLASNGLFVEKYPTDKLIPLLKKAAKRLAR